MFWSSKKPRERIVTPSYGNPMGYSYRARVQESKGGEWICTIDRFFTVWERYESATFPLKEKAEEWGHDWLDGMDREPDGYILTKATNA